MFVKLDPKNIYIGTPEQRLYDIDLEYGLGKEFWLQKEWQMIQTLKMKCRLDKELEERSTKESLKYYMLDYKQDI